MNIHPFRSVILITALFVTCLNSSLARAGMVDLTLFGETTNTTEGNIFGLNVGDPVSLRATFDSTALSGTGFESITFTEGSGNSLNLFMGDLTFSAENDADYFIGFPTINFIDGVFSGIDYMAYSGINGAPANLFSPGGLDWSSFEISSNAPSKTLSAARSQQWISGIWDDDTLTITSAADIPEPGPLALAAIGLLGAWIASRRKETLS